MPEMMGRMDGMWPWPFGPLMMVVFAPLVIVPFWFIFAKAGFPRWLSLLMIVPIANIVMHGTFYMTNACGKRWIAEKRKASVLSILTTWVWTGSPFVVPSSHTR